MFNNLNYNILGFGREPRVQFNTPYYSTYIDGDYQVVKFYYVSGSTVSGNGSGSFLLPYTRQVEYLIIGGGGAGGATGLTGNNYGAGGGAGQLISGSFLYLANQQYNFIVGAGGYGTDQDGAPYSLRGYNGLQSTLNGTAGSGFLNLTAIGGGGGGAFVRNGGAPAPDATGISGSNGGSGGGAGYAGFDNNSYIGGPGYTLAALGSNGGNSIAVSFGGASGGGGGATQAGGDAFDGGTYRQGGNGGSGSYSAISGSARFYAGGGAGGGGGQVGIPIVNGIGGIGGGGNVAVNGEDQAGAGGGASAFGGSGVIILRWNTTREGL